mgnify:FL=1|tara:strand:- start:618 stop:938 length:321 start_codon:yes stop_codon:yes gene_type:complete
MTYLTEAQYRKECRKLIFDENVLPKRINNIKDFVPYKSGFKVFSQDDWNLGRCLKCPKCDFVHLVYHFSWSAKECHGCKQDVEKKDFLLEVRNFKSTDQFFNKEEN